MPQSATTRKTYLERLGSEVVNVHVGKTQAHFAVHKELLCKHSAFFAAAFNGNFMESQLGGMTLPADTEEAFDVLVEWLYTGKITDKDLTAYTLCELYLQSDKFQIVKLQCLAMEAVRKNLYASHQAPTCGLVRRVYEHTDELDPLRRYLTDVVAYLLRTAHATTDDYKRLLEARSPFAVELSKATERLNDGRKPCDPRLPRRIDYSVPAFLLKRKLRRAGEPAS